MKQSRPEGHAAASSSVAFYTSTDLAEPRAWLVPYLLMLSGKLRHGSRCGCMRGLGHHLHAPLQKLKPMYAVTFVFSFLTVKLQVTNGDLLCYEMIKSWVDIFFF